MGSFRPRNLIDVLQILWRRKWLILSVMTIVLLAAFIIIINIPHVYESRARIVVSGQIYDRQANGAQIAAVTEQITSRANLESLITRYGLYAPLTNMDRAVINLQTDIKLDTKYRSDSNGFPESFTLAYRHADPATAQKVVTELLNIFNQANTTLEHQAQEEARSIHAEIAQLEARLTQTKYQRAVRDAHAGAAGRAAAARANQHSQSIAIASTVEDLKDRQYVLQQKITNQKQLIVQQQEIVRNAAPTDDGRAGGSYNALLKRQHELEAQIADYLAKFTDKYPRLVQAREQLAEVNQRLAEAGAAGEGKRASAASPEAQQLRMLQSQLNEMQVDLDVVEREMRRKLQAGSTLPNSASAVPSGPIIATPPPMAGVNPADDYSLEGLKERYTALLKREDALREFQPSTAGPGTPFFQIVDPPNLPQAPAAPLRSKLMLYGLVLALAAGLMAAIVAEFPRLTRIYDERDIKHFLGVPVVALIPETFTVAERTQAAARLFKRRLLLLLAGAVAVPALVLLLNSIRIFQILGNK